MKNDLQKASLLIVASFVLIFAFPVRAQEVTEAKNPESTSSAVQITKPQFSRLIISGVNIEKLVLGTRDSDFRPTTQMIVSWNTNLPSSSQVEVSWIGQTMVTPLDDRLTLNHQVFISSLPSSSVINLNLIAAPPGGSQVSYQVVAVTPKTSNSPIEVILDSLIESFGFLRKYLKT